MIQIEDMTFHHFNLIINIFFALDFNILYIFKLLVLILKIVKAMKMHLNGKIMW
jgi:hypothetical protein